MKVYIIGSSGAIGYSLFNFLKKKINVVGTFYKNKKPGLIKFSLGNEFSENRLLKKIKSEDKVFFLSSYTSVPWIVKNKKKNYKLKFFFDKKISIQINKK